ncbi:DUF6695 family protein [Bacteroidota bacterium]
MNILIKKKTNNNSKRHNGFAIALAWPETHCKQPGAWYDTLMYYFGINRNGYYWVGHAAIVLIDDGTQTCRYYDFGRYHAPPGFGRVRSEKTDHDLRIETKAVIANDLSGIINIEQVLSELYSNKSTHGSGTIYGAVTRINVDDAISFATDSQKKEFINYGPFISQGTNCSRFVSSTILAGKPILAQRIKLQYPLTISPTPMWNLKAIGGEVSSFGQNQKKVEKLVINPEPKIIGLS